MRYRDTFIVSSAEWSSSNARWSKTPKKFNRPCRRSSGCRPETRRRQVGKLPLLILCCGAVTLWRHDIMMLWRRDAVLMWRHDAVTPWYCDAMIPSFCDAVTLWRCTPLCCNVMGCDETLWYSDKLKAWGYDAITWEVVTFKWCSLYWPTVRCPDCCIKSHRLWRLGVILYSTWWVV